MNTTRRTFAALAVAAAAVTGISTVTATAQAAPSAVATGVKSRAEVPWKSVGTGWVAMSVNKNGRNNLVLASPGGQSYQIATLSRDEYVFHLSSNGSYAITNSGTIWNLKTGKVASVWPVSEWAASFTKPTGTAALGFDAKQRLVRRSVDGTLQRRTTTAVEGNPLGILPAPNGLTNVISTDRRMSLVDNGSLRTVRSFRTPSGYERCAADHFADATHVVFSCVKSGSSTQDASTSQVFSQSINGGAPVTMTRGTYPGGIAGRLPLGFTGAWTTTLGALAAPNSLAGSGAGKVFRMSSGAVTKTYTAPLPADIKRAYPLVTAMTGTSAYLKSERSDPSPTVAVRWDVATNTVTYLGGPRSQYGGSVSNYALAGQ